MAALSLSDLTGELLVLLGGGGATASVVGERKKKERERERDYQVDTHISDSL